MSKTLKERILPVADAEEVSCNDVRGHLVDLAIRATAEEKLSRVDDRIVELNKIMVSFKNTEIKKIRPHSRQVALMKIASRLMEAKYLKEILKVR